MKIRKYVIWITMILLGIFLIFSYIISRITEPEATKAPQTVQLSVAWTGNNANFSKAFLETLNTFSEQHPSIQLTHTNLPESPFLENDWRSLYLSDGWPDLMEVTDSQFPRSFNLIAPVPPVWASLVAKDQLIQAEDKNYWYLPIQSSSDSKYLCIYYNKALFKEYGLQEPTSYEDFIQLCHTIAQTGTKAFGVAGADSRALRDTFLLFLADFLHQHPNFYQNIATGKATFNQDYLHLFQEIKTLLTTYGIKDWTAYTDNGLIAEFNAGRVAMIITDQRVYGQSEESPYFQVGSFLLPGKSSGTFNQITNAFQRGWVISKQAIENLDKRKALYQFLKFYYSKETTTIFQNNQSFPPPRKDLTFQSMNPTDKALLAQQEMLTTQAKKIHFTTLPFEQIPYLFQFFSYQTELLKDYLTNQISLQEVEEELVKTWQLLEKETRYD